MTEIGIIVGRRPREEILAAFLREGHDLAVRDPARGEYAPKGRHPLGALRIHDDAEHFTFRSLCPIPHSLVEVTDSPGLAGTMRGIVHACGGFLRDARGAIAPAATPEGDNPDFDLLRRLHAIDGLDHRARTAIARLAHDDPDAFRQLGEALAERGRAGPDLPSP